MLQSIFGVQLSRSGGASQIEQVVEDATQEAIQSEGSVFTAQSQSEPNAFMVDGFIKTGAAPMPEPTEEIVLIDGVEYRVVATKTPDGKDASRSVYLQDEIVEQAEFTYHPQGSVRTLMMSLYENGEMVQQTDFTFNPDGIKETETTVTYENGEMVQQTGYTFNPDGTIETGSTVTYENGEVTGKTEQTFSTDGIKETDRTLLYENGEVTGKIEQIFNPDGSADTFSIYNKEGEPLYTFNYADKLDELAAMETSDESGYTVKYDGNVIIVEDEAGEAAAEIDLDILLEEFKEEKKGYITEEIKKLPPEALIDLYNENVPLSVFETHDCDAVPRGVEADYHIDEDGIYIKEDDFKAEVLAHELGHAIDYMYYTLPDGTPLPDGAPSPNGKSLNLETSCREYSFYNVFDEELDAMMEETGFSWETCIKLCYGSKNPREAFAESYTLMMFPELAATTPNYDLLQRYFPRTIAVSEKMLGAIRELPQEYRGRVL